MSELIQKLQAHLYALDEQLEMIGGCSDGDCIVKRPVGQHTNGGCRCPHNKRKMQHLAYTHNHFVWSVRKALENSNE